MSLSLQMESLSSLDPSSTIIKTQSSIENDWNWLLSLQMESLCFLDPSSTMIRTFSSIESEWNPILFFSRSVFDDDRNTIVDRSECNSLLWLRMRFSFSRCIVDNDQNTVFDWKWLELTSLSTDGISLFSRFIVDNDPNTPRSKRVDFTSCLSLSSRM